MFHLSPATTTSSTSHRLSGMQCMHPVCLAFAWGRACGWRGPSSCPPHPHTASHTALLAGAQFHHRVPYTARSCSLHVQAVRAMGNSWPVLSHTSTRLSRSALHAACMHAYMSGPAPPRCIHLAEHELRRRPEGTGVDQVLAVSLRPPCANNRKKYKSITTVFLKAWHR